MLDLSFVEKYRTQPIAWGYDGLGELVFYRTYSRKRDDGMAETWVDTLKRVIEGAQEIGANYTQEEAERLFDHMFHFRALPGGRMLWQLGTDTVRYLGANSLLNCAFVDIRTIDDFCFLFDSLMLGCGVGFSTTNYNSFPTVKPNVTIEHIPAPDADFIVPDSREGWVKLLREVLFAFFYSGKSFTYSTILVRPKGTPIKRFGGVASGPEPLIYGMQQIAHLLQQRAGKKITSIDILDICNIIGSIVIAGNVRRSAEIALGFADDTDFLKAKRWDLGNIPNWRAFSNNTVICSDINELPDLFWEGYHGNGEPYGLYNPYAVQKYGRIGEEAFDPATGINPCGEIPLESYEFCNLSELFLPNFANRNQFFDALYLLYKLQKAVTQLPYTWERSQEVVHRNQRIGMSISGWMQCSPRRLEWIDKGYQYLRKLDATQPIASIRLTTVKPSGTLSLLAGTTPGVHPAYAPFFLRRIAMEATNPLVEYAKKQGYDIEYRRNFDGTDDPTTVLVTIPCRAPKNAKVARDVSAIEQLEMVKMAATLWADNAVSVTVYYRDDELPAIRQWLRDHYHEAIKSVSFLRHSEHGFDQAPYEEIDEVTYMTMWNEIKQRRVANTDAEIAYQDATVFDNECAGGVCPIR
jgi:ribonucleotide reductase alpha subunit